MRFSSNSIQEELSIWKMTPIHDEVLLSDLEVEVSNDEYFCGGRFSDLESGFISSPKEFGPSRTADFLP